MSEDDLDDLAMTLAQDVVGTTGDPGTAAAVLYQASVAVLFAHFPAEQIAAALKDIMEIAHADVAEALGEGATVQ
ncbi:hypothetical protein [Sphingobium chungbukense]|uniref:Uncharacterized protein n=1 Tax=Sphingobium chungbukense TaxID=56193 RepID=A0A0M3AQV0_9SPHN|nr:hypothetical protein [Sphingobium chungbukense]KKW92278.1 hypothetical protein YP76_10125 [Sphingobium chungbukense]